MTSVTCRITTLLLFSSSISHVTAPEPFFFRKWCHSDLWPFPYEMSSLHHFVLLGICVNFCLVFIWTAETPKLSSQIWMGQWHTRVNLHIIFTAFLHRRQSAVHRICVSHFSIYNNSAVYTGQVMVFVFYSHCTRKNATWSIKIHFKMIFSANVHSYVDCVLASVAARRPNTIDPKYILFNNRTDAAASLITLRSAKELG